MTPEDDVNKKADQDANEKVEANSSGDDTKAGEAPVANDETVDAAEKNTEAVEDDIDRAASAQAASEEIDQNATEPADSDPLDFLDSEGEAVDPDAGDELTQLNTRLSDAEAQVASYKDQLLRLQAEMENQRKRAQNDITKAHKFALEKIALDLLPVKDSLEMGLIAASAEDAEPMKIVEGSELTLKMLAQALEKYNIVEINPIDEKFDPEFHQAMSMAPVEGKEPNTVASVMQKGYTLNDRLIRPALVMVAK